MDQAWQMEEELWHAGVGGGLPDYYARVMAADAVVIGPEGRRDKDELLRDWHDYPSLIGWTMEDRHDNLINGETAVLTYRITVSRSDGIKYTGWVSSVYTWIGHWVHCLRHHSPAAP
jgi:hypothetical protein